MNKPLTKATHQQTKNYNNQLVLKTIFDYGQISRAEVARLTHLTRVTVSEIVADLIVKGLVAEVGHGPSSGGRLPILVSVVDDARHLISVDLAKEAFHGAVVNLRGNLCYTLNIPSNDQKDEQALLMAYRLIDELIASTDRPILGIGIGTPGLVDTTNGMVLDAVNLNWKNLPLGNLLAERYNLPVYIANDSQVAALAEYIFGNCETHSSLIAIKLGQGIGSGIVLNGQLYQGEGFGAGEIGHVQIIENGLPCSCGHSGCLETVASSRAIVRRAQTLAPTHPGSLLNQLAPQTDQINFNIILQAYQAGDPLATQIAQEAGHYLGIAAANLVAILNIHNIVLTGDITAFGQPWLETVRLEIRQRALDSLAEKTDIKFGCLGANVVILGASALLLTRELGLSLSRYPGEEYR